MFMEFDKVRKLICDHMISWFSNFTKVVQEKKTI
jgi:TorA maturation chaperone TorD